MNDLFRRSSSSSFSSRIDWKRKRTVVDRGEGRGAMTTIERRRIIGKFVGMEEKGREMEWTWYIRLWARTDQYLLPCLSSFYLSLSSTQREREKKMKRKTHNKHINLEEREKESAMDCHRKREKMCSSSLGWSEGNSTRKTTTTKNNNNDNKTIIILICTETRGIACSWSR